MNDTEGNNQMQENDRIERLRSILERQQVAPVTFQEASEIGENLISFFETLAEESIYDVDQLEHVALEVAHE